MNETEKVAIYIAQQGICSFQQIQRGTQIEQKKLYDILNALQAINLINKDKEKYKGKYKFLNGEKLPNAIFWDFALKIEQKQLEIIEMIRILEIKKEQ
ncbi:E2F/DP family winged-helix DNA-binding domain-containing protein [Spironucleus salmonicida]|uniref:E2F/DP family winged-helix DNA-binding domain-containing protein n=1 Tax=Spironucleus salmonicida TaxID=348837 RepID=V6LAF7_9EUKA|nr:E2F/DP family winged-helix DNA-binding domain-containing protein [Spironucleus salmonicida]|eukprot:EST41440.1 E2F/DP family winged-helix DNA-binding domain-containing protein [Spironucleus salmonicida]